MISFLEIQNRPEPCSAKTCNFLPNRLNFEAKMHNFWAKIHDIWQKCMFFGKYAWFLGNKSWLSGETPSSYGILENITEKCLFPYVTERTVLCVDICLIFWKMLKTMNIYNNFWHICWLSKKQILFLGILFSDSHTFCSSVHHRLPGRILCHTGSWAEPLSQCSSVLCLHCTGNMVLFGYNFS